MPGNFSLGQRFQFTRIVDGMRVEIVVEKSPDLTSFGEPCDNLPGIGLQYAGCVRSAVTSIGTVKPEVDKRIRKYFRFGETSA